MEPSETLGEAGQNRLIHQPAKDRPLVVVVGPTASGKSSLALRLAEAFSGEIVNCDSLQLFRGFDIGTAKLSLAERRGIPHHMIDAADPGEVTSAGSYARTARQVVAGISERGKLPIVAGGTGFYLRALLQGLPPLPERDPQLREKLADREAKRAGLLHRLLRRLDPPTAAIMHPNDVQKLMRTIEILMLTRRSRPDPALAEPLHGYRVLQLGLDPDREALKQAIAIRSRRMFELGLIDEVRRLLASGATGREKPFESLGYRQALEVIAGQITVEMAIESTAIETRQYAKRQMTWFRRDAEIQWLRGFGSDPEIERRALARTADWLELIARQQER